MTLTELSAELAEALSRIDVGSLSGRVRDVPNARTIRYYTTLGLVDRPLAYRGRTALYGRRHLLQLVAIKRLQARGLTLSQCQEKLLSIPEKALADLAGLPQSFFLEITDDPKETRELEETPSRRDTDFWAAPPAEPSPPEPSSTTQHQGDLVHGVRLTPEVTLLLGSLTRSLEESDIQAIQAAAGPLIRVLVSRRLLGEGQGKTS